MPKKILLADDSLTIQKVVELTFSDSEYDLVCVGNGMRALEKVRESRPDLILADVVMPEKNGYEVCEAIKGDPQTARIPVILLTGTFEPFDRQRADRIGADAIVSKPFDSQQLLRQVEALLSNTTMVSPEISAAATMALPLPMPQEIAVGGPTAPPGRGEDAEPFDAGFAPDDFTGSIRIPTGDPFEEEFERADADSAAAVFEKAEGGRGTAPAPNVPPAPASPFGVEEEEEIGGPSWLGEEPERPGGAERPHWVSSPMPPAPPLFESPAEAPTAEIRPGDFDLRPKETVQEIDADAAEVLFDVPAPVREPEPASIATPPEPPAAAAAAPEPASHPHEPHELEALAQTSSIPELAQMLTSVSRSADLSDADLDRLAARIVEKLSDRVIREIAWEVIPDMAEIVIKQRIKELEAGLE